MGMRVKRVRTTVSEPEMVQAIIRGWQQLVGTTPTKEQVSIILSQNALETANRKKMWNYNIGNITTDGKGVFNYFNDLPTQEQIEHGKWEEKYLKYRAYPDLQSGVNDYLKLLKTRYTKAWSSIIKHDPVNFSKSLKERGYYTANEAPYTKALSALYKKFNKSNSYENARSGNFNQSVPNMSNKNINDVLSNYIKMIAASEKYNKKLYKQYLPYNNVVIVVQADNFSDGVEFSTVLCSVLQEELLAKAHTHTDGFNIEVECSVPGPKLECFNLIEQLTECTAEAFKNATKKIGGVIITTSVFSDKKSSYSPISFKMADSQHRQFLLKFI